MAGSTKMAVLATLMFAMLLSGSIVDAARPIVPEGSVVAADGTQVTRHGRRLNWLFGILALKKCLIFGYCPDYHPYYNPKPVYEYGYHGRRRLQTLFLLKYLFFKPYYSYKPVYVPVYEPKKDYDHRK